MRWLPLLAVAFAGCASANVGGGNDNGDAGGDDDGPPGIDAPVIDAAPLVDAPISVNLTQTGAANVVATQIGCQQNNPATGFTTENSYYRTFPLSDFGITTPFHITDVTFAIERATAGNGVSMPAQVRLGTYSGTINANNFPLNQLTPLASATITIPNNATSVTTPITAFSPTSLTVQPSAILYAELLIPDGRPAGNTFYVGSNNGTETHPSYIRAADCNILTPTSYAQAVGTPVIRLLLTVNGTH